MDELITIQTNENEEPIVSARELHKVLGVKKRFSAWWETQIGYGFEEGLDYVGCTCRYTANQYGGIQELDDYAMRLDMAKELAMVSKTEKGKEVRKYFIQIERIWNDPEQVWARALKMADKTIAKLKNENNNLILLTEQLEEQNDILTHINQEKENELQLHRLSVDIDNLDIVTKRNLVYSVITTFSKGDGCYQERWNLLYDTLRTEFGINARSVKATFDENNRPKSKSMFDALVKAGYVDSIFECMCQLWLSTVQEKLIELYNLTENSSYNEYEYYDEE